MDDPASVCGAQTIGELTAEVDDLRRRERAISQTVTKRQTGDVLRDQEIESAIGIEIVNDLDVGMVQLRKRQGFVSKPPPRHIVR